MPIDNIIKGITIAPVLSDNSKIKAKYDALNLNSKEFFKIDIGDIVLDAWMIKPIGFDPFKKFIPPD